MLVYFFWIYVYLGMWVIFFNTCKTDNLIQKDVFSCLHSTWNFNWMKYFLFFNCKQRKTRVLHCNCYSCCNPVRFNRWRWCQPSGGINAVRLSRGSRCGAFSFSQNDAKLNSEHNKHLAEEISSPYQSDAVKETDYQREKQPQPCSNRPTLIAALTLTQAQRC